MKPALALAALVALSACKRAPEEGPVAVPTQEVVAGVEMIDFTSDEAKFTARLPGRWGVREEKHLERSLGISLSGPVGTHIVIFKYPEINPQYKDARVYADSIALITPDGKPPVVTEEKMGDHNVLRFHYERMPYPKRTRDSDRPNRLDFALIPVKDGFYEIKHTASVDTYRKTLPVFEAVVRSFKPRD
ncbi:MAG: hypothetical protein NUW21_04635 [Elusimicrobia bacterium]|nr:hypothetical protein [Elusimicrobiota bacterium]